MIANRVMRQKTIRRPRKQPNLISEGLKTEKITAGHPQNSYVGQTTDQNQFIELKNKVQFYYYTFKKIYVCSSIHSWIGVV